MFNLNGVLPAVEESRAFFESNAARIGLPIERLQVKLAQSEETDVDAVVDSTKEASTMGADSPVIIAFADGVSPDKRQALLNCVAYSERYANQEADRKTEAMKWHEEYALSMMHCGWTGTNYAFKDYDTSSVNVTMESLVLDIVLLAAGANAAVLKTVLTNVFSAIKNSHELITLFDRNSKSSSVASCQIMPCVESKAGIAVTVMTGLECNFSSTEGGAWFWKWKASSLSVKNAASVVEFNFGHYKNMEGDIVGGLGESSRQFFKKVSAKI